MKKKISAVLIANRGEIACRIIKTLRRLKIRSVAVYSDADKNALHVQLADQAIYIGEPETSKSYLNTKAILEAAKASKVDAIHPGYGFLSENADFADAVKKEHLIFIGPSPEAMRLTGDKLSAKKLAVSNGIPVLPSLEIDAKGKNAEKEIQAFGKKHGYPLLIKAAAGGGGRGMRKVLSEDGLSQALEAAASEALSFFKDGRVYVEKFIEKARHIEVQLFGDSKGDCIHLFDRDCSLQRRHQKVIEEAPVTVCGESVRKKIQEAAVKIGKASKYESAGTVEFLLDLEKKEDFFFLEVNSRLQVEHTITEEITGLDLVELQIKVAEGESLKDLVPSLPKNPLHSIECRLLAESPEDNFMPATGVLLELELPDCRFDTGFLAGSKISHFYDSLIGKIIVNGKDRNEAISNTLQVLDHTKVFGLKTNLGYLRRLLESKSFKDNSHFTNFAEALSNEKPESHTIICGLCLIYAEENNALSFDPWASKTGFSLAGSTQTLSGSYKVQEKELKVSVEKLSIGCWKISGENNFLLNNVEMLDDGRLLYTRENNIPRLFEFNKLGGLIWTLSEFGCLAVLETRPKLKSHNTTNHHSGNLSSPLPGKILKVNVKQGAAVKSGDALVVIESMKMEHLLKAPSDAEVKKILVKPGDLVESNRVLLELELFD